MCTELCMDRHKIVAACVARTVRGERRRSHALSQPRKLPHFTHKPLLFSPALRSPRGVVCVWGPETGRLRHCLPTLPADTIRQMGGDGASTSPAGQEIGAPSGVQGVEEEAAPVPEWALLWPRSRDVEERLGLTPEEHAVSLSETPMALAAHGPVIACATAHGAVTAWNFDECVRQTGPLEVRRRRACGGAVLCAAPYAQDIAASTAFRRALRITRAATARGTTSMQARRGGHVSGGPATRQSIETPGW